MLARVLCGLVFCGQESEALTFLNSSCYGLGLRDRRREQDLQRLGALSDLRSQVLNFGKWRLSGLGSFRMSLVVRTPYTYLTLPTSTTLQSIDGAYVNLLHAVLGKLLQELWGSGKAMLGRVLIPGYSAGHSLV